MAVCRTIALILFALISLPCIAQEDELIKDIIESFADNLAEDYDLSELTEQLVFYRRHPIDLNNTNPDELKKLVFLSALQISNYFTHLHRNGKLLDILELQGIDGFDTETISRLNIFARVKSSSSLANTTIDGLLSKSHNDLIFRYGKIIETQKGFRKLPGSRYLGGEEKMLLRYRYKHKDAISVSLVAEKDAGEQLWRSNTGIDYLSGNISLNKVHRVIEKLIIGDYSMQFGQGLTLWSGFSFGKGPDVTSVAGKDAGLRPYSSSNEASFLRGMAGTLNLTRHIQLTPFGSFRKLDASLKTSPDNGKTLQNINISGLHRTATELKNQRSVEQTMYGAALQYSTTSLNIGAVSYQSIYQHEFVTGSQLYNKYSFTGKRLLNTGIHYNYTLGNVYLFGEAAHSSSSGWATVSGAMASLSSQVSAVLLFRNYDRNYHNFLSSGVGEGTETSNEKGCYAGVNYSPSKKWVFSVYGDYFRFPWLRYRVDLPSEGYEAFGQVSFVPKKTFKMLLRYKREVKQQNPDTEDNLEEEILARVNKQNVRLECNWKLNSFLDFQQRAEVSGFRKGSGNDEHGYLICQDMNYRPPAGKLSGNMRIAYFNTSSYDSRIYAYEDDVLYGSSFGGYFGKGIRSFINMRYKLTRQLDLWGRYAIYVYQDRETVGSGLDEINGNRKSDFKFQFRYQF